MNCNELVERVTDFLEGALTSPDLARFNDHVHGCVACAAYLREVRVTLRLVSKLPSEPLSDALEASLLATYRRWADTVRS